MTHKDVAEIWEQVAQHRERKGDTVGAAQARANAEIALTVLPSRW